MSQGRSRGGNQGRSRAAAGEEQWRNQGRNQRRSSGGTRGGAGEEPGGGAMVPCPFRSPCWWNVPGCDSVCPLRSAPDRK